MTRESNPIIRAVSNPNRTESPYPQRPLSDPESSRRIVDSYTDAFHDGLNDWLQNPKSSLFDCIRKRTKDHLP